MSGWRQRLRGTRVTLGQLGLVSMVSAAVSAVIVVGALGETGPEKAVIAALRTRQVIHEHVPASTTTDSSQPVADTTATPTPVTPAAPAAPSDAASSPPVADTSSSSSTADAGSSSDTGSSPSAGSESSSAGDGSSASGESSDSGSGAGANQPTGAAGKIKHVFVVVVSTPSYTAAFGQGSVATYLNGTLRPKGVLLSDYQSLGSAQLPDSLAMVSGQTPNPDTEKDCPTYADFPGGVAPARDGLVAGTGCVYPNTALTVGDQLDGADLAWRGYMDGMTSACQHPNSGAADLTAPAAGAGTTTTTTTTATTTSTTSTTSTPTVPTTAATITPTTAGTPATPGGDYATRQNPFVYFHSLLDLGDCQSDDLPLTKLAEALRSTATTPDYAFVSPNPCDAGTAATCPVGAPTGIAAVDAFLHQVVPGILASPAYRSGGALVIAFSAAPGSGGNDAGPVRTGALVLSPHAKPGTEVAGAYNPYSLLRTVEDVFGLTSLAKAKSAHGFDQAVFTR